MDSIITYVRSEHSRYIDELTQYLAVPSISADDDTDGNIQRCAQMTADFLTAAGMHNAKVNKTARHPVVTAEWLGAPGAPTIIIYGHYDVQPVDPLELWDRPPFEAYVKNDRIIARGSSDDKGQLFIHIKAVEAVLKKTGKLPINVKFLLEGEEEIGSPSLPAFLREHKKELTGDIIVISDTDMHGPGIPAITYGLKGLAYMELEVIGPDHDLHSGEYGGAVANPVEILARMIATVKDEHGRIQIPGFYDKVIPISPLEKASIAKVPFDEPAYLKRLDVEELWGEAPYTPRERTWARPTFEVNGMWGGFIGKGAKTVLPSKAGAKISMRLVANQEPAEIEDMAEKYFTSIAPKSVKVKVIRHHGGRPVMVPLDNPFLQTASRALTDAFGHEPYYKRTGGSIPIVADFKTILGLDSLLIGFSLSDARAHSPNENFYLPSFFTGIEASIRLMYYLAK